jgi:hypothetical protein
VTRPLVAVVLDHTALLAMGSGSPAVSRMISYAHRRSPATTRYVYVPALCLAAASAERPGLAEHIGALPAVEVVDLGFAHVDSVGRLISEGIAWEGAHAAVVALPDAEWLTGRPIMTRIPKSYAGLGVSTVAV